MWDHEVENNELAGMWMWLCPHQGTVLPEYAVMVVSIKIRHHILFMQLGHLLTHSGVTYPEVSSKVCHDSFCQLGSSILLPWVMCFKADFL